MPERARRLRDLAAAEAVAREAGACALAFFHRRESLEVAAKGLQDMASNADREVEELIRDRLARLFPDDGFLGEETGAGLGGNGRLWVVDPIDGTWCFLNGIRAWCVSLAAVDADGVELGVVYDPCAGELFSAARGLGARLDGRPIRVREAAALCEGTVSVGFSHRSRPEEVAPVIGELLARGGMYHRHGSGALALAWLAAGRLIGYLEPHMNSWDCLAGLLLVREAGGFASDLSSAAALRDGGAVMAGPMSLYDELVGLAARHFSRFVPPPRADGRAARA